MKKTKLQVAKPPVAKETIRANGVLIRKGNRFPFRRGTQEEIEERICEVADFISERPFVHNGEIRKFIKDKFKIQWNFANTYILRAKALIVKRSQIPKEKAKEVVTSFLFNTLRFGNKSEALKASEQLSKIYGMEAPKNLRVGDPEGRPLVTAVVAPTVVFNIPHNSREKNGK